MEINKLALEALEIACRREANGGAKVTDILKHLAGEVIEAEEALTSMAMLRDGGEAYAEELADIIICALIAAAADDHTAKKEACGNYKRTQWLDGVTKKTAFIDGFSAGMRYAFEMFGKTEQLEKNPVVKDSLTTEIMANGKRYQYTRRGTR